MSIIESDESYRSDIVRRIVSNGRGLGADDKLWTAIGADLDVLGEREGVKRVTIMQSDEPKTPPRDGGPAFPQHGWSASEKVHGRMAGQAGLSLRDYFAAAALPVLIKDAFEHSQRVLERNFVTADRSTAAAFVQVDFEEMAAKAYVAADKMLEARKR